jgi:hypothetical protein
VGTVGDRINVTDSGMDALPSDFRPLPTGDELRRHWLERLPEGERRILALLIERYPEAVAREELGDPIGYKRSSRDAFIQRLAARRLVQTERGTVRASGVLFS